MNIGEVSAYSTLEWSGSCYYLHSDLSSSEGSGRLCKHIVLMVIFQRFPVDSICQLPLHITHDCEAKDATFFRRCDEDVAVPGFGSCAAEHYMAEITQY